MSGRIRSIKPEWAEDEKLAAASDEARVLSICLILIADDHGNGRAHPAFLASHAWAYGDPRETLAKTSRALAELSRIGFVTLYVVAGQGYFSIRNWARHQKVDHPGKPRVPTPDSAEAAPSRDTLARPSRGPRETLAPDLRPPTSDHDHDREGDPDPPAPARDPGGTEPEAAAPAQASNRPAKPEASAAAAVPPPPAAAIVLPGPPAAARRATAPAPRRLRIELEPDAVFADALELWGGLWREQYQADYVDRGDREPFGQLLRDLRIDGTKPGELEQLERLFLAYLADPDRYLVEKGHPLRTLCANVNKYRAKAPKPRAPPPTRPVTAPPPMSPEQQRVFARAAELRQADGRLTREAAFARAAEELGVAAGGAR
jgi:hypothetical protein